MDPLSDVLTMMRPTSYGFRGLDAAGDWALAYDSAQGIRCIAIETGTCRLWLEGCTAPTTLQAGDVVLMTSGAARLGASDAAVPVDAVALLSSVSAGAFVTLNGGGDCIGVGGFFQLGDRQAAALLATLPPLVHVGEGEGRDALLAGIRRLMRELREPRPGGALLASHLAQALLIEALRAHLKSGQVHRGWLAALAHPNLRRAMEAMHGNVAHRWSLGELAQCAGMSRSSFAAHFEQVTGETPIGYLARWRMTIASDRLARGCMSLSAVAASVGYQSESAFGAAFKRVTGRSPRSMGKTSFQVETGKLGIIDKQADAYQLSDKAAPDMAF
ncbi:AraC family transcriptional regulator [Sphingomonas sp. Leaf28]|uniref:AraC family transcriptional regulator n=1 Tax=Sphingomonas sp. Leaf28 TaxID=1735695 RepID=UPI0009EA471F|nr:AraC family transcriptional regulator [Sphingomonas sp. Leaf28]